MSDQATNAAALAAGQAQGSELVALKQQVDRLRGDLAPRPGTQQKLRKACQDFEAVFISKMWEQMRATVPKEGYLHSPQEDMYRSMFDRDFAEKLAADGGVGLGDMLYSQLKDKLKNVAKTTGVGGAVAIDKSAAMPLKPLHTNPEETALERSRNLKPLRRENPGIALDRKAAVSQKTYPQSAPPHPPASVSGEVMAEVDALARRIEEEHARRQSGAGYGRASGQADSAGRKLATIG